MSHADQPSPSDPSILKAKKPLDCMGMSLVTVVFGGEMDLLRLQARSLSRFMPASDVQEILVVLNDWDLDALNARVRDLRVEYGVHADKLRILHPGALLGHGRQLRDIPRILGHWFKYASRAARGRKNGWQGSSGWLMQQALKLGAARAASGQNIVFLDAKNHLIGPAGQGDFFENNIRPRGRLEKVQDNYFEWHVNAHRFFGLPPLEENQNLVPSITPFVCRKSDACAVITRIEQVSGALKYFFRPKSKNGTEFTLVAAQTSKVKFETGTGFASGLLPFASIFRDATEKEVDAMLDQACGKTASMLGTHSGRIAKFTSSQKERLVAIWIAAKLVPTSQEGHAILARIAHG